MKRSRIHAFSVARAARSASIASGMGSDAGGNSAAWSISPPSSARAGVVAHAGGIALRLAGHSRALPA